MNPQTQAHGSLQNEPHLPPCPNADRPSTKTPVGLFRSWAGCTLSLAGAIACLIAIAPSNTGCSRSTVVERPQAVHRALTPAEAADLAARLANQECARLYQGRRPFSPGQHEAKLHEDQYEWGGLDPGAKGGYSAFVTFHPDGSSPKVEVYFSTDILMIR